MPWPMIQSVDFRCLNFKNASFWPLESYFSYSHSSYETRNSSVAVDYRCKVNLFHALDILGSDSTDKQRWVHLECSTCQFAKFWIFIWKCSKITQRVHLFRPGYFRPCCTNICFNIDMCCTVNFSTVKRVAVFF